MPGMSTKVSVEEANAYLDDTFEGSENRCRVMLMEDSRCIVRLEANGSHLRPGGYISGPTQMSMVDTVVYMAIMTKLGIVPMAVTTSLNMTFLRPCIGDVVEAEARLMKLGRTLAVADVDVRIAGAEKPSSHAVVTYAIPQDGGAT